MDLLPLRICQIRSQEMVAQGAVVADMVTILAPSSSLLLAPEPHPQNIVALLGGALASMIANLIVDIISVFLCIKLCFIDSEYDGNGELVFINFSVLAKSVSCLKQFTTAYHALHTKRSAISGFVDLFGFILQSCAILIHLIRKYKAWARTTIVGMVTLMAAGIFLLCRGMLIPDDHAWNTIAVSAIIIFLVSSEAALVLRSQENEDEVDQPHLRRDLVMKLVEESISIYRWVESIAQAHSPLDLEKVLNLVVGGLPVLIVAYQIAWILYKMGIMCRVVKLLGNIRRVFPGDDGQAPEPAMEVDEDGILEKQVVEQEGVEIVVTAPAAA